MTTDDGGWIVYREIERTVQLSFNKNWREYEEGFGDLNKYFWAGLELMHTLTQRGQWEMRVDYQKNDKTWLSCQYVLNIVVLLCSLKRLCYYMCII